MRGVNKLMAPFSSDDFNNSNNSDSSDNPLLELLYHMYSTFDYAVEGLPGDKIKIGSLGEVSN